MNTMSKRFTVNNNNNNNIYLTAIEFSPGGSEFSPGGSEFSPGY